MIIFKGLIKKKGMIFFNTWELVLTADPLLYYLNDKTKSTKHVMFNKHTKIEKNKKGDGFYVWTDDNEF